jgi:hypothetical protein
MLAAAASTSHYEVLRIKTVMPSLALLFKRLRQQLVGAARLSDARWMIVRECDVKSHL